MDNIFELLEEFIIEDGINEINKDELESRAISSKEWLSKSKKKEPEIPLKKQKTVIIFNEFEKGFEMRSTSSRLQSNMQKMGIEPCRRTVDCRWYDFKSKHQIVLKKKPAKQARCSKDSCTL